MFGETHQFLSFCCKDERRKYWLGRLVLAKTQIRVDLFNALPCNSIGMVVDLEDEKNESAYVLVVRWASGNTLPCYQHSVYSYQGE